MAVFLLLLFVVSFADVEWYAARNLREETKNTLLEQGCFRGNYGIHEELQLFTCLPKGVDLQLQPFAILSDVARLCVVEPRDSDRAKLILKHREDEVVIWYEDAEGGEMVIGKVMKDDLVPALCSRSDYEGAAWNVIRVPPRAIAVPIPVQPFEVSDAPNAQITALLNKVDANRMNSTIAYLSINFNTRLSTSNEANQSVAWVVDQLTKQYGWTNVVTQNFRSGYCPNIIATLPGTTNQTILIGSHLDCRGPSNTNVSARAPGADDNGSGMAATLELARLIKLQNMTLRATLVLAAFCGEEQGLYGSTFMANDYKSKNANLIGMYNADMIGYRCGSSSTLTFDSRGVSANLTNQCKAIVPDYLSGFPIGDNSGCCSDNQQFQANGYPTVSFFECPGTTVTNPQYHRENDTITTINLPQLVYFAKALYACALTQAVPL